MSETDAAGTPSDLAAVRRSEELFAPVRADLELCYQTYGDAADPTILLVMGLGGHMTWWPDGLCRRLAAAGYHVVRYDNRDVGRSSRVRERMSKTTVVQAFLGRPVRTPYTMSDLAEDGVLLLDHLGVDAAHVAGVSMGGMIVQTMALEHPDRVRSMTSVMSTTGNRRVGWQHPRLLPTLIAPRRPDLAAYIENTLRMARLIGSPKYAESPEAIRARAEETHSRGVSGAGILRQMGAILTQPDRTKALGALTIPVAVLHGRQDRMVHVSGGRATAAAVPGAQLTVVDGMGHDLPTALLDTYAATILGAARRAEAP
ncbi:alpha/beta hydrolase [Nocardioides zeae]|uniref:Alpha/beta hydrolase n=1 Tax=Nocardioides imazamoxiresistens TaxID=3231893 RepID=A0ABU3PZ06_9ACTN|nr:alpha/beta hydrolase [Nocardioides zeae]MDT9594459.1 alpha/beta hydrolase [Nocardioides zeae]